MTDCSLSTRTLVHDLDAMPLATALAALRKLEGGQQSRVHELPQHFAHCLFNSLEVYQRDAGCGLGGLILSAKIYAHCGTVGTEVKNWGLIKSIYR